MTGIFQQPGLARVGTSFKLITGLHTLISIQGDATAPLRSSLAGLRLGERVGGGGPFANRAFSHADLHSLSSAYSDVNAYASHPDLARLAVRCMWSLPSSGGQLCLSVCLSMQAQALGTKVKTNVWWAAPILGATGQQALCPACRRACRRP